jgi:hypothetical protein
VELLDEQLAVDRDHHRDRQRPRHDDRRGLAKGRRLKADTRIRHRGETRTIEAWAAVVDIPPGRIISRLRAGWSVERALTEPLNNNGRTPAAPWRPNPEVFDEVLFRESLAELLMAWRSSGSL